MTTQYHTPAAPLRAVVETLVAGVVARAVVAQHSFSDETVDAIVELVARAAAPETKG